MAKLTEDELINVLADALKLVRDQPKKAGVLAPLLYEPRARLPGLLQDLEVFVAKANPTREERVAAGILLEQLMLVTFAGLRYDTIASYQSAGPQIDLLVNGSELTWQSVASYLRIDPQRRGIVVEAKATEAPVSTAQFLRVCALMQVNLATTVSLGVFFTIKGATGFPDEVRRRSVSDARLEQMLFMARHRLPVVVLDLDDIRQLNAPGALVQILAAKVQEVEACTGMRLEMVDARCLPDLPDHLKNLI